MMGQTVGEELNRPRPSQDLSEISRLPLSRKRWPGCPVGVLAAAQGRPAEPAMRPRADEPLVPPFKSVMFLRSA